MNAIDVVIPCYRYAHYLDECVGSVLSQAGVDVRILIVDDASPDDTPIVAQRLVQRDSRVNYVRNPSNIGHISTYNKGIAWVEAPYMLLLSADDFVMPDMLRRAVSLMETHPDMSLCFGEALELYDDYSTKRVRIDLNLPEGATKILTGEEFVRLCVNSGATNIVPTPSAVVNAKWLKQLGGYRADLPHSGDLEMWLRLAAHGGVGFIKDKVAVYRRHGSNMSLGYCDNECILDLQQRKAAFDAFFETCSSALPSASVLHRELINPLGYQAVMSACSAFDHGRMDLCSSLLALASEIDPSIHRTRVWKNLAYKRFIGPSATNALRFLFSILPLKKRDPKAVQT